MRRQGGLPLSADARHAEFLTSRLREMGLEIELTEADGSSAAGRLPLSATPFPTLSEPVRVPDARFYTLGHARLKFSSPGAFFRLPALDVSRCGDAGAIESTLRLEWSRQLERLRGAQAWLVELGAEFRVTDRGSRVRLQSPSDVGIAEVLDRDRLLLPTRGALADIALRSPSERCYRALPGLESALELELGIGQAVDRLGRGGRTSPCPAALVTPTDRAELPQAPVLIVVADRAELALAETALSARGLEVVATANPQRALAAVRERTFAAAILDAHLPRSDGLELSLRISEVAGIEKLPVMLLDDRPSERMRTLAEAAGAAGYLIRPVSWDGIAETVLDLVLHWSKRRYERFVAELGVAVDAAGVRRADVAEQIGRGGMLLRSARNLRPGNVERYSIRLPNRGAVQVDGEVIYREEAPGSSLSRSGIRFVQFLNESEARWIEAVRSLAGGGSDED